MLSGNKEDQALNSSEDHLKVFFFFFFTCVLKADKHASIVRMQSHKEITIFFKKKVRLITATGSSAASYSRQRPKQQRGSGLEFGALIRTTGGVNCQSVRMSGV